MEITTSSGSSASPFPPGFQFRPFRFLLGLIGAIGILITFVSLLFGFVSIPTNSVGVKLRFGAYHSTEGPGLAYAIPYVDEITLVPTQRLLKLEFGFSTPQATNEFQGDTAAGGHRDDDHGRPQHRARPLGRAIPDYRSEAVSLRRARAGKDVARSLRKRDARGDRRPHGG